MVSASSNICRQWDNLSQIENSTLPHLGSGDFPIDTRALSLKMGAGSIQWQCRKFLSDQEHLPQFWQRGQQAWQEQHKWVYQSIRTWLLPKKQSSAIALTVIQNEYGKRNWDILWHRITPPPPPPLHINQEWHLGKNALWLRRNIKVRGKHTISSLFARTANITKMRFLILHPLYPNAKNAARARASSQRGDEYSTRNFESKGHNR